MAKNSKVRTNITAVLIGGLVICICLLFGLLYFKSSGKSLEKPSAPVNNPEVFQVVSESEYNNDEWKKISYLGFNEKTISFYIPRDWEASMYTSTSNRPEIEVFPTNEKSTIQNLSNEEQKLRTIVITVLPEKDTFGNLWGRVNLQTDRRYTATRFLRIHKPDDWDAVYSEREKEFKEVLYINHAEDVIYIRSGAKVVDSQNVFNTIVSSISLN